MNKLVTELVTANRILLEIVEIIERGCDEEKRSRGDGRAGTEVPSVRCSATI